MHAAAFLFVCAVSGCAASVPTPAPARSHMVRLHGSAKDCDEEVLSIHDRDLCTWLHGRNP